MSRAAQTLQARVEVMKLARLLDRDPDTLAYLEPVALDDLRALRERLTATLFDAQSASLKRLGAASRLLPATVSATIGETAFGPLLSARIAGLLDPGKAVDVASRLPAPFLADIAVELDPRRASELIAQIPRKQIAEVTAVLVAREEYVTMGRFVGALSDGAITAALEAMDDRSLLKVVFVLEDKSGLPELVELLPKRRIAGVIRAAADNDMWVEALDLLDHLSPAQRAEMVAATLELEPAALHAITAAVIDHDLWEEILPLAEQDANVQAVLAAELGSLTTAQREAVAQRAREHGHLERLGLLGEALASG